MNLKRLWRALLLGVASAGLLLGTLTMTGAVEAGAATTAPQTSGCHWVQGHGYWTETKGHWSWHDGYWSWHNGHRSWHEGYWSYEPGHPVWHQGKWSWYCPHHM